MNLPDALLGSSFYKFGYVTTDCERAIEHFQKTFGFEEFVRFEPQFDAEVADGDGGPAHLRCAFSAGRSNVVELMEPYEGAVDLWREPIREADGFAIAFHHIGFVAEDLGAVRESFAAHGIEPALTATIPVASFGYWRLPEVGHYVEHIQYFGEGGAFLANVRAPKY